MAEEHERKWYETEEKYITGEAEKREIRAMRTFYKGMFCFEGKNFKEKRGYFEQYLKTFDLSNVKETLIYFKNYLRSLLSFIL